MSVPAKRKKSSRSRQEGHKLALAMQRISGDKKIKAEARKADNSPDVGHRELDQ